VKRLLLFIFCLLIVIGGVVAWAVWYVRPAQPLDLAYRDVSLAAKFNEMVRNRQPAFELTEADINNLLKKQVGENPVLTADLRITGANFNVDKDLLTADVNLLYKDKFPAGVRLHYYLDWKEPDLKITYKDAAVKGFTLPASWFRPKDYNININGQLPGPVGVKEVVFGDKSVKVWLKLQGLQGLPGMK
jgi:hypothetical protein